MTRRISTLFTFGSFLAALAGCSGEGAHPCHRDIDCLGDRICTDGRCVDPPPAVPATPTASVQVGTDNVDGDGSGPECQALFTSANGQVPLAFGLSREGRVTYLTILGEPRCVLDRTTTARVLLLAAVGGDYLKPADRAALWSATASVDLGPVLRELERCPDLQMAIDDQVVAERLAGQLAQVASTSGLHTMAASLLLPGIMVDPKNGLYGLEFRGAKMSNDHQSVTVTVGMSRGPEAEQVKAILVNDQIKGYVKGEDVLDIARLANPRHAYNQLDMSLTATSAAMARPPLVTMRVISPSMNPFGPPLSELETWVSIDVQTRTIANYIIQALIWAIPDLGEGCIEAIGESIIGLVSESFKGVYSAESLSNAMVKFLSMLWDELWSDSFPKVVAQCSPKGKVFGKALELLKLLNFIRDRIKKAGEVKDMAEHIYAGLVASPELAVHQYNLCGACPGATENSLPDCYVSGGRILCSSCDAVDACKPGSTRVCGNSGTQVCSYQCQWGVCGMQTCVGSPVQACGRCGIQTRVCANGMWLAWSACANEGPCTPQSTQSCGNGGTQKCLNSCQWDTCSNQGCVGPASEACGNCGTRTRTCRNGAWSGWSACANEGSCAAGNIQACGNGGSQQCGNNCQWGPCLNQGCVGPAMQSCGNCGTQSRTCVNGVWSAWTPCANQGSCSPNAVQTCGNGGTQICSVTCQWDACTNQSCVGPASQACGRCGIQTRTCTNGAWSAWSACANEGACAPNSVQACNNGGTQTCTNSCQWGACVNQGCIGCVECQTCVNAACQPAPNGTACSSDNNPCTEDSCQGGLCQHSSIQNDCGAWKCGSSPSGCFSCGTCPNLVVCDGNGQCRAGSPTVSATPNGGAQGDLINESGCGFTPGGTAELHFLPPNQVELTAIEPIDGSGCFQHPYQTGDGTPPGEVSYWAFDLATGKRSANTVVFNITCSMGINRYWKQYAGNDTDHQLVSTLNPQPVGWTADRGGRPVFAICRFPVYGTIAIYEQYNGTTHDHIYTTDPNERQAAVNKGFTPGTVLGYIGPVAGNPRTTTALYRLVSVLHSDHLYTVDINEAATAVANIGYAWDPIQNASGGGVWATP